MSINPVGTGSASGSTADQAPLRQAFESAFGQTLFGQMLSSMRKTVGKPAYFHGGRGEEVFQRQLDQVLAEKMSRSSASQFVEPAFDLFMLQRK
jgi:peptidoglycan hydrolase FlgJ